MPWMSFLEFFKDHYLEQSRAKKCGYVITSHSHFPYIYSSFHLGYVACPEPAYKEPSPNH